MYRHIPDMIRCRNGSQVDDRGTVHHAGTVCLPLQIWDYGQDVCPEYPPALPCDKLHDLPHL